jgi:NADPH:quinone reductase-like Zn-dependent oxidoreductase
MKAVIHSEYGGPDVLRLAEVPTPVIGPKDLLVRVHGSSANPADVAFMSGRPALVRAASGLRRPRAQVLGRDFAGVVDAIGDDVTGVRIGDEVFGEASQAFAEYVSVRPNQVARKPANLTFEQAATVPLAGVTAWQAWDRAGLQAGQRVLVNGASGGVGHFAVQIAKALGAQVTAVCSGANAEMMQALGAEHVIDYRESDFTTLGQRYDVIFDAVVTHRLADTRRALAPSGTYLSVGTAPAKGPGEGGPLGPLPGIAGVLARSVTARPQRLMVVSAKPNVGLAELTALVEEGSVAPFIERSFPLDAAADALRLVAGHHARGKVAITV